jgi:hypothetical protein
VIEHKGGSDYGVRFVRICPTCCIITKKIKFVYRCQYGSSLVTRTTPIKRAGEKTMFDGWTYKKIPSPHDPRKAPQLGLALTFDLVFMWSYASHGASNTSRLTPTPLTTQLPHSFTIIGSYMEPYPPTTLP